MKDNNTLTFQEVDLQVNSENPATPDCLTNLQYCPKTEASIKPRPLVVPSIPLSEIELPPPMPPRKTSDKRLRAPSVVSTNPTLPSPKRGCLGVNHTPPPLVGAGEGG